jgi:SAM-dependent methyltransferase
VPLSYDHFATHFDAWQRAFGAAYDDLILPRVLAALARHRPPVRRVVDLGTGTGVLVVALARAGYAVTGVDRSRPMLEVARAKIAGAGLAAPPALLEQDLRSLDLDEPVDAAICVYTVMNQLTGDGELGRAMTAIRDALVAGGLLLFELNLPQAYERYWTGVETVTLPDAIVTRSHRRRAPIVEAHVVIRRADGSIVGDRIAQREWADAEVEAALASAGFVRLEVERFDPFEATGTPTKALWSAQRVRA